MGALALRLLMLSSSQWLRLALCTMGDPSCSSPVAATPCPPARRAAVLPAGGAPWAPQRSGPPPAGAGSRGAPHPAPTAAAARRGGAPGSTCALRSGPRTARGRSQGRAGTAGQPMKRTRPGAARQRPGSAGSWRVPPGVGLGPGPTFCLKGVNTSGRSFKSSLAAAGGRAGRHMLKPATAPAMRGPSRAGVIHRRREG